MKKRGPYYPAMLNSCLIGLAGAIFSRPKSRLVTTSHFISTNIKLYTFYREISPRLDQSERLEEVAHWGVLSCISELNSDA